MTDKESEELFGKYIQGNCTIEEIAIVESWYNHIAADSPYTVDPAKERALKKEMWTRITGKKRFGHLEYYLPYYRTAAAALVVLCTGAAIYYNTIKNRPSAEIPIVKTQDFQPGSNKAILILANGKTIVLDSSANGQLAIEQGVTISKSDNGQLVYKVANLSEVTNTLSYNSLITPKGGQYQVILPDGSKVYLNADSKITYPTRFASDKRTVNLTGEGYFEITKDAARPFKVESSSQIVSVTGTHFNVSCYLNEMVRTTLLEGKVAVTSSSGLSRQLIPGQQSRLMKDSLTVVRVDTTDVIGWKNGLFVFKQTPVKEAFAQISRWYNVDVDYTKLPDGVIDADLSRAMELSVLLKSMESSLGVKLTLEGGRIEAQ